MRPVTISQTDVGSSSEQNIYFPDTIRNPFNIGFGCVVAGTVDDYTIEHTFDSLADIAANNATWFPHPSVENASDDADGTYAFPVTAIRITIATGDGTVTARFIQAGHRGA